MQPESHDDTTLPSARGKDSSSKPLEGSLASQSPQVTSSGVPNEEHMPQAPSSTHSSSGGSQLESTPDTSTPSMKASTSPLPEPEFVVKAISVTTQPWGRRPSPPPRVDPRKSAPKPEPLPEDPSSSSSSVLTAEAYPWAVMTSTLEACFDSPDEPQAQKAPEAKETVPSGDESPKPAKAESQLPDERNADEFSKAAPAIMQSFHAHGDACAKAESDSLKLAMRGQPEADVEEPLQDYYDMLSHLESLQSEATSLEASINKLTSEFKESEETEVSARSQVLDVISGCLPVLRARISNLSMAQELVDSAQENVSLGLRMEQLGL